MLSFDIVPEIASQGPVLAWIGHDVALVEAPSSAGSPPFDPPFGLLDLPGQARVPRLAAIRLPGGVGGADAFDAARADYTLLELCLDLDTEAQARLLAFLLGFCRAAFRLGDDPVFANTCRVLAASCAAGQGTAEPCAALADGYVLLRGVRAPEGEALYLLGQASVRLLDVRATPEADGLQACPGAYRPGDVLLCGSAAPRVWVLRAPSRALPSVLAIAAEHPGALRALQCAVIGGLGAGLAARAARDGDAQPLGRVVRNLQLIAPAPPVSHQDFARPLQVALDLAISDLEGGVFLKGWLHDPLCEVAAWRVTGAGQAIAVPDTRIHRLPRPDLREALARAAFRGGDAPHGFMLAVQDPRLCHCLQPALQLRLRDGGTIEAGLGLFRPSDEEARNQILGAVPPQTLDLAMLRGTIAPMAAALHARAMRGPRTPVVRAFGTPAPRPEVSVIVPLYRNLGFLRFQVAAFASEPSMARADVIYVLDSPEQQAEAEHLLRGLHLLHGLPMRLALMPRNLGYAGATNAGAALARAPALLLLNSDVVPAADGWLRTMLEALEATGAAAAGARLLFEDGSLQHAGLYFTLEPDGLYMNRHYHKGMPGTWGKLRELARVPAVTGAAMLVDRARYEAVGGVCEDYIVGDYEDSDLCLRLRAAGGDIRYAPGAALYHFERRSIGLHAGYARTAAAFHNRDLHHRRWSGAIAALMAEPGFAA